MTGSRMPEQERRVELPGGSRRGSAEAFPLRAASDSEPEDELPAAGSPQGRGGNLLDFLQHEEDDTTTSRSFYDQLQALKIKNRHSLLELGTVYQAQVEGDTKPSKEDKKLENLFWENQKLLHGSQKTERSGHLQRSGSLNGLTADTSHLNSYCQSVPTAHLGSKSATLAWASPITVPKPFNMTLREAQKKAELITSSALLHMSIERMEQSKQEEAECQRQFRAVPVPAHVYLPLYQEMKEQNEARRSADIQRRSQMLLSTQKPFSFVEKEEQKKQETRQKMLTSAPDSENNKRKVVKKIPKSVQDPTVSDKLKEAELYRKIRLQMRAEDLLKKSAAPIDTKARRDPQCSAFQKTQAERLSFLQENLRFQPRTNPQVPDFEELYWAFQRKAMKTREIKEATRNKPFNLSTSNLRSRPRRTEEAGPKDFHEGTKSPMRRSHSLTGLSSLSSNTLPVYITDGTKRRESAIRCSLEEKQSKESEQVHWMLAHRKKSQAMHKSVSRRAKALDPHKPLEETFKEKLRQNWRNDQKRTKEYNSELDEMKRRVQNRPYLFEQVTKRDARKEAERRYRSTLQEAGLSEDFVRNKGELAPKTREEELEDMAGTPARAWPSRSTSVAGSLEGGGELADEHSEEGGQSVEQDSGDLPRT